MSVITQTESSLFSRSQAARVLGISESTLERMLRRNEISHYRFRNRVMFSRNHLDTYLAKHEQKFEEGQAA